MVGFKSSLNITVEEQWELRSRIGARLRDEFPSVHFNFTQPIADGISEDTIGTSADVGIEFLGADLPQLRATAEQAAGILRQIPGAVDVFLEQDGPRTQLTITPDRVRCAQYDVHIESVRDLIDTTLGGEPIGAIYEDERRFDIVARFDNASINSPDTIGDLPVFTRTGVPIPLSQVADFSFNTVSTIISREDGSRKITARCNVVGRDELSFVREARARMDAELELPEGCRQQWIGQFENIARSRRWFLTSLPLAIAGVYALLLLAFHSQRRAAAIISGILPALAAATGVMWLFDLPMNVPTEIGLILLCGMSVIGGVMLVQWIEHFRERPVPVDEAVVAGVLGRLRAVLMASLGAIFGILPAAIVQGPGTEFQRPLAIVIVSGLAAALAWTLLVLPMLYRLLVPAPSKLVPTRS
jgi:cobalt-zinc-cadmium resistance protein CzcA